MILIFHHLDLSQLIVKPANSVSPDREVQLENAVTSIAISEGGEQFYVGTEEAQMYQLRFKDFTAELISTGHRSAVKDIALPQ